MQMNMAESRRIACNCNIDIHFETNFKLSYREITIDTRTYKHKRTN